MAFQPIIYTFGASEYLNSIFESMSLLFDFSKNSDLVWLYRIAGVLGVIFLVTKAYAARGSDGSPGSVDWPWFIRFSMILMVIIVPKSNVQIQDLTLKRTYVVSNAPWALSHFGWLVSSIGYGLTNLYENSLGGGMNPIESYSGNGIAFGSRYYNSLTGMATFSATAMNDSVQPFIAECLIPAGTGKYNPTFSGVKSGDIFTTNDFVGLISAMNDNFLKNRYVYVNSAAYTCYELRTSFLRALDHDSFNVLAIAGIADFQTVNQLDNIYLKQATDAKSNSLKQAMIINALYSSVQAQSSKLGDSATAASIYQAQAQFQKANGWREASVMASTSLVWLHIVVECMIYAIWTLCTFLFLFPNGWMALVTYVQMLFWIQLWPILYAVLNSIIAVYATSKTNALALQYSGFTTSDFFRISDLNGGIVITAGFLSTMVPVISWMFLQKAGSGVAGVLSAATTSSTDLAKKAGEDESKGNLMMNKVTVKDTNFAGNETTGSMTSKQITSTGSSTTVDGNTTVQSSAMDNKLTTNVDYNQMAQKQLSNMAQEIHGQAGSQADSWSNIKQSMHNASVANSSTNSSSSGSGGRDNEVIAKGEALAADLAVKASAFAKASGGLEIMGTGGSAGFEGVLSGSMSTQASADYKKSLDNWKDYSTQNQAILQSTVSDSFNQSHSLAKSSTKTIMAAENLTNAETKLQSMGSSLKSSGDNDFVQHLMSEYRGQGLNNEQAAQKINDMQFNDSGQFNKLASDYAANVFVPKVIGDGTDYKVQGLNHQNIISDINRNSHSQASNVDNNIENSAQGNISNTKQQVVDQGGPIALDQINEVKNFKDKPAAILGENLVSVAKTGASVMTADGQLTNLVKTGTVKVIEANNASGEQMAQLVKPTVDKVGNSIMQRGTSAAKMTQKGGGLGKNGYPTYRK